MKDELARRIAEHGDDPEIAAILQDVCALTGMGFAAVAHVTETRWIVCQVLDQIEFGLTPGGELDVATTICTEIRDSRQRVVIDHVEVDRDWCTHPTPILYGFQSYVSIPITLADGSFYGTLCAIDPTPHRLNAPETLAALEGHAARVAAILSSRTGRAAS